MGGGRVSWRGRVSGWAEGEGKWVGGRVIGWTKGESKWVGGG